MKRDAFAYIPRLLHLLGGGDGGLEEPMNDNAKILLILSVISVLLLIVLVSVFLL